MIAKFRLKEYFWRVICKLALTTKLHVKNAKSHINIRVSKIISASNGFRQQSSFRRMKLIISKI